MTGFYKMRFVPMVESMILNKMDEMEDFKSFINSSIEREKKAVEERMKRATKGMSEKEMEEYYEWFSEDYVKIDDLFAQISINAFLIMLYSYIESGLNSLCDAERHDRKIDIRYKDMKGKGIEQAKIYLEKVIRLNLKTEDNPWKEIRALNKIRNAIVHEEGSGTEEIANDERIKASVKKGFIDIEIREIEKNGKIHKNFGKIVIKPAYLDYIIPQVRKFFENTVT